VRPWESVPATPQTDGGQHRRGGQQGVMPRSRAAAMASGLRRPFPDPDATRRRIFASSCAMRRRARLHQGPGTRHILKPRQQERQPTCAACPNLAATAVSPSLAPCQFRQDSCRRDWVRFAIFFIDLGRLGSTSTLGRRPSSFADDGGVGAQRQLPRAKRTDGSRPTSRRPA
jgi:hypothetical protein